MSNCQVATEKRVVALKPADFRHGTSVVGNPLTWTGKVVSLEAWRDLTEWEKHGPDGRHWNGINRKWEATS